MDLSRPHFCGVNRLKIRANAGTVAVRIPVPIVVVDLAASLDMLVGVEFVGLDAPLIDAFQALHERSGGLITGDHASRAAYIRFTSDLANSTPYRQVASPVVQADIGQGLAGKIVEVQLEFAGGSNDFRLICADL
jgi:hypothetical protein